MADNFTTNAGSGGDTFGADDVGGTKYPRVKLGFGTDGNYGDVNASNPLPVAEAGGALTALQLIDDMIASLGVAIPGKGALMAGSDGTNARAVRVDSNGRLSIDINSIPGVTVGAALPAGGNAIGTVGVTSVAAGTNNIGRVTLQDAGGDLANISAAGQLEVNANQAGSWVVSAAPRTSGGVDWFKKISTANTNATLVKSGAGQIYEIIAGNVNASARYLKLYDKASGPTVGTDVPKITIPLHPSHLAQMSIPEGIAFTLGIAMALTTESTDTGSSGVAADEIVVNLGYK